MAARMLAGARDLTGLAATFRPETVGGVTDLDALVSPAGHRLAARFSAGYPFHQAGHVLALLVATVALITKKY